MKLLILKQKHFNAKRQILMQHDNVSNERKRTNIVGKRPALAFKAYNKKVMVTDIKLTSTKCCGLTL